MDKNQILQQLRVLSPRWAIKIGRKIKDHTNMQVKCRVKGELLNLTRYDRCIVGEAYLFDIVNSSYASSENNYVEKHYECVKCTQYSNTLNKIHPDKFFLENLQNFITHFKDKHKRRYIKKLELAIAEKEKSING